MAKHINTEKGSVVLIALLVLMLISLYGVTSLNSSVSELKISQNLRYYKQNLYRGEAAVIEVGRLMDLDTDPDNHLKPEGNSPYTWIHDGSTALDYEDQEESEDPEEAEEPEEFDPENSTWIYSGEDKNAEGSSHYNDGESGFTVIFCGVAPGASLSMSNSQVWEYKAYGLASIGGGRVGVVSGYRNRF